MQISRGVYSAVPPQGRLWAGAQLFGGGGSGIGPPEREPHRRRASAARSCAHAAGDSAQVGGGAGGELWEGEERRPLLACRGGGSGIFWGSTSGRGDTWCRRWRETKKWGGATARRRRPRTDG